MNCHRIVSAATLWRGLASLVALALCANAVQAHPVPKENHDRTLVVRLQKGDTPNEVRIRVEYRLEVDESTVLAKDMLDFQDKYKPADYFPHRPLAYYAHYAKICADTYASFLEAKVNKHSTVKFVCVNRTQQLHDEQGNELKHLRCDFVFTSKFTVDSQAKTHFSFYDKTYWSSGLFPEPGQLVLKLVNESGVALENKIEPTDALRKEVMDNPELGDEALRKIEVVLAPSIVPVPPDTPPSTPQPQARDAHEDSYSLLRLILHSDYGFWLTMLLAFLFGSAHALTPGHGKTLVAAYLVGERGTIWHAGFLGIVTTLTHTGVVLIIAIVMTLLPTDMQRTFQTWLQNGLGLVMGLTIACMGFWLLLQRLAGRADHIHLDGGHHHHHGSVPEQASLRSVSWWGLVVLGITGGLVPCWDAIILLFYTLGSSRFWLVLPALLSFSAGLAMVLVAIGVMVVQVPRFVESRWGSGRFMRSLPIVSAVVVTLMGLWLCYEGVHGK